MLRHYRAFRAEEAVSFVGKTLLPLKTPPLQGERVAAMSLAGDTPKEEVNKFKFFGMQNPRLYRVKNKHCSLSLIHT